MVLYFIVPGIQVFSLVCVKKFTPIPTKLNNSMTLHLQRGVTLDESDALQSMCADHFANFSVDLNGKLSDVECSLLKQAMHENDNNQTRAAKSLGIKRETLIHKLKKYNII